jgi:hypothetical protein
MTGSSYDSGSKQTPKGRQHRGGQVTMPMIRTRPLARMVHRTKDSAVELVVIGEARRLDLDRTHVGIA